MGKLYLLGHKSSLYTPPTSANIYLPLSLLVHMLIIIADRDLFFNLLQRMRPRTHG